MRNRAVVARKTHNLEVGGSSPSSATKFTGKEFSSLTSLKNYESEI